MTRNDKILVTGSSGFIGRNLTALGRSLGLKLTTLDESGDPDILCDIREVDWNDIGLSDFDFVIHLAAKTSVSESVENPEIYFDVNSAATDRLFRACSEKQVKRVVFASSAAVYGESIIEVKKIGEEGELSSPYALTKLEGEEFARDLASESTQFSCLRLFNVYGPLQSRQSDYSAVIPTFINKISIGETIEIHGDGNQTRDFIHVDDVSKTIISSLSSPLPNFSVFNVGSGKGTSIIKLANIISGIFKSLGIDPNQIRFTPSRLGDVRDSTADLTGLKELIDIESLTRIEDGLRDLVKRTLDEFHA